MLRAPFVAILMGLSLWFGATTYSEAAVNRPLKKLPADLFRWSLVWVEVPKRMYEVGQDHGPLAAMTWGPTKGTMTMVGATGKELWGAVQTEKHPAHKPRKQPNGPLFRYEF